MNRSFVFLLTLLTICAAQKDSGRYINRIKIETFANAWGVNRTFTYYVKDSYDQIQKDNFTIESGAIGYLYEDDYTADTVSCTTAECPKLRRIYEYTTTVNGKVTTRLLDSALKASLGATTAKPIGFVAPYPGYCSSDDLVPIIEMYSDYLQQYGYWSPLQLNQVYSWGSYRENFARYVPTRLVGYALSRDSNRTVLYNAAPDFVKPIGKANYTHSFFPTYQYMWFGNRYTRVTLGAPAAIDAFLKKDNFASIQSHGAFVIGKGTAAEFTRLSAVCGELMPIYTAMNAQTNQSAMFARTVPVPFTAIAQSGWTFKENRRVCGGIKGLAPLREFRHRETNSFAYSNDPTKFATTPEFDPYEMTSKNLGYAPLDQFGFLLVNATI